MSVLSTDKLDEDVMDHQNSTISSLSWSDRLIGFSSCAISGTIATIMFVDAFLVLLDAAAR